MKISFLVSLSAFLWPFLVSAAYPPANITEAKEFCNNADLMPIEGLWTYPEDDVTVIIYRSNDRKGIYDIHVVEAADCSLHPCDRIGELSSSADPDKYNLKLFTNIRKGILCLPQSATATYSESKESLSVKKSSVKFNFNPTRLLPYFWRIVSVSFRSKEPAPEGMIKIYPSYDGNGSTRRGPRYL